MDKRAIKTLEFEKILEKLANSCSSALGKELVNDLKPTSDYYEVESSLKETTDAVEIVVKKGSPPLGGIRDIRKATKRVELGGILNPGELLMIADVLRVSRRLKKYLSEDRVSINDGNCVNALISQLNINKSIETEICNAIISEDEISDNASNTLYQIRRKIRNLQDNIKDRLNSILKSSEYQKYMQDSVVTMRGDRYVIPVKQEHRSNVQGLVHDISASGATIFIEPMAVVNSNNEIKELKVKEEQEIEKILKNLTELVLSIVDELKTNVELLSQIDFIFAKAFLSLDIKGVCPILNNKKYIKIKKGRHPLIDKEKVVPIDIWIGDEFTTLVITGPNTGGKTVSLKTLGLFVLMTQSGLHIPAADGSEMGIFDNVFADIGDEQSIEQSLSTFSAHMTNIVHIMKNVSSDSLVLFDELGAGTDPVEGAALAAAILDTLKVSEIRTAATTHYSELKLYAMTTFGVINACCEFNIETLRPTYRLLIGIPGKSNAFAISKRLGLTDDIIESAKEYMTNDNIRFEDVLSDIEKNRTQAEIEKEKAEVYRKEIEIYKNELEVRMNKAKDEKDKILQEARREARKVLQSAKEEANELIDRLKELEKLQLEAQREKEAQEIKQRLKNKINDIEDALCEAVMPRKGLVKPPKNLKPGDTVMVVNMNQKGTIIKAPGKDGEALVQVGIMKISAHVTNLKRVDEQKIELQRVQVNRLNTVKSKPIKIELDVRGFNLEEATEMVDKYIDDACIAGLSEVTIIHGKGTGILRSGIQSFLKGHGHVKEFRLGKYGEGETGVTVVSLK